MDIEIDKVGVEEKAVLRCMLELYQHDHAEWDDQDLDEHGLYGYRYLDHYWTEHGRHAYFIRVDGRLAGFAMVRDGTNTGDAHHFAEMFIVRKYRRQGLARRLAFRVFDLLPGKWEVRQAERNVEAQAFWRAIISEYTGGDYTEVRKPDWDGPMQVFESKGEGSGQRHSAKVARRIR